MVWDRRTMTQTLFLKNARIIDGNGGAPTESQSVLVRDGRISEIAPAESLLAPADGIEIDLSGKTLLPGFIDCHVHILGYPDPRLAPRRSNVPIRDDAYMKGRSLLYAVNACHKTLEAGFTTIRDLGGPNEIFALRDSLAAGEHIGPRLLAAGKGITHTGGHGTEYSNDMAHVADGADEVLKAIRYQAVAGADAIKIIGGTRPALSPPFRGRDGYTTEELIPGVQEAHRAGIKVAAHAHSHTEGIKKCIRAGVDSIEHGFPLDEEAADMMAERGTYLCPTLSVTPAAAKAIEEGLWTYPGLRGTDKAHGRLCSQHNRTGEAGGRENRARDGRRDASRLPRRQRARVRVDGGIRLNTDGSHHRRHSQRRRTTSDYCTT